MGIIGRRPAENRSLRYQQILSIKLDLVNGFVDYNAYKTITIQSIKAKMEDFFLYATSLIALIVSVAGYLLNRTLHNQNKVFDEKLRAYTEILKPLNNMMNVVINNLSDGKEILKYKETGWENDMNALADEIDEAINTLDDAIIVNSLLIPNEVLTKFDDFIEYMENNEDKYDLFENQYTITPLINELNDKFDSLSSVMRDDLDSDKLNKGLSKRIRGNWVHKLLQVE